MRGLTRPCSGRLLRPLRSGIDKLAGNDARIAAPTTIDVASPAFASGTPMPERYRGVGGFSPPLAWSNVPAQARELVLIVEDVDVPFPQPLVHAIVYSIPTDRRELPAGAIPRVKLGGSERIDTGALGRGAGIAPGWVPVTPIPGHGPHRYVFQLFALDAALPPFTKAPSKANLVAAMSGHVPARGAIVGLAEA